MMMIYLELQIYQYTMRNFMMIVTNTVIIWRWYQLLV